jgi:hypothetical protein
MLYFHSGLIPINSEHLYGRLCSRCSADPIENHHGSDEDGRRALAVLKRGARLVYEHTRF